MSRKLVTGQHPKPSPGSDPGGRPSMLEIDPTLKSKILAALRIGAPIETAAMLQGINYDTLRSWVVKGRQNPDSQYGALLKDIERAVAEWEVMDLSVIESHAKGRPAQYAMDVVRDSDGNIVFGKDGEPIKEIARDADGNPIVQSHAIKSDWRASMERLSRRNHKYWGSKSQLQVTFDPNAVLTFDNKQPETKETISFEESVAKEIKRLEEEV